MTYHYIYLITNILNEKIYIGQTVDPKKREYQHFNTDKTNKHLFYAIQKYGKGKFKFEIIAMCKDSNDADDTEIYLIATYGSTNRNIGYNIAAGGRFKTILTQEELNDIIYNPANNVQMAKKYNVDRRTIRSIRRKHLGKKYTEDAKIRKQNCNKIHYWSNDQIEAIVKDTRDNTNVGKEYNVCSHVIKKIRIEKLGEEEYKKIWRTNKILTNEEIQNIVKDTRDSTNVGKNYGVSRVTINSVRRKHLNKEEYEKQTKERKNRLKTNFTDAQIEAIVKDTRDSTNVAKEYNVSWRTIKKIRIEKLGEEEYKKIWRTNKILTNEEIQNILKDSLRSSSNIGKDYGVSKVTINNIRKRYLNKEEYEKQAKERKRLKTNLTNDQT